MEIHVIRPRDTLWGLARRYGTSISKIIHANRLDKIPSLIPGQALLIPNEKFHYKNSGPDQLPDKGVARLPKAPKRARILEVNGYMKIDKKDAPLKSTPPLGSLTYISPMGHYINEDGTISDLRDDGIIMTAKGQGIAPLMILSSSKNCRTWLTGVLNNLETNGYVLSHVIGKIKEKNYRGLILDLQGPVLENWKLARRLIAGLADKTRGMGRIFGISMAFEPWEDKVDDQSRHLLFKELNELVDFVIVKHQVKSIFWEAPQAPAPLNQIKSTLTSLIRCIPANKIIINIDFGGYDWSLPVMDGRRTKKIDYWWAMTQASHYKISIQYDRKAQTPYFDYMDEYGIHHSVWFEDVRSIREKYKLVGSYGLRGVSYSDMETIFSQNWLLLDHMFQIKKV